jgi:hypothetical protein
VEYAAPILRFPPFLVAAEAWRLVLANPAIVVGVLPLLVWQLLEPVLGLVDPPDAASGPATLVGTVLSVLRAMPGSVLVHALADCGTLAVAAHAMRGSSDWRDARASIVRTLPSLFVLGWLEATVAVTSSVFVMTLLPPGPEAQTWAVAFGVLMLPAFYLIYRLAFVAVSITVDGVGPFAALRRGWRFGKGRWWFTFMLLAIAYVPASIASVFVPPPARPLVAAFFYALANTALVVAYVRYAEPRTHAVGTSPVSVTAV